MLQSLRSVFDRRVARGRSTLRWFQRDEAIMGTAIHVELACDDAERAELAMAAVMQEMHRIDAAMSPYKADSELSQVNRLAGGRPQRVSGELFDLLLRAQQFAHWSGGAFDITYAAAGHLYDYRRGVRPSTADLARVRGAIGYRHLLLDREAQTVSFARPGMRIDLGGFAKGHAVNNAAAILVGHGIRHAIVSAGGDSRVIGDRAGRPWTIGVRDPRREGDVVAVLPLEDVAVSTSGDYERYFERNGVRYHHLIDPRTGEPARAVRSVTVIAPDGLTSEALSKTVFILGVEAGLRLVQSLPGADAVVIDADGVLHATAGLTQATPVPSPAHTH